MKRTALPLAVSLLFSFALSAGAATRYVNLNNPAPVSPYTNWVAAATNIQDAVDAAVDGDLVWVTNGVYQTGARELYGMSNRVAVTRAVVVQSVNGPGVTVIRGYQVLGTNNGPEAVRCVYLTNGTVLAGFTLTDGATQAAGDSYSQQSGGGIWCESSSAIISNCTLTGNAAAAHGGGAYGGRFINCSLTGNSAKWGGGTGFSALTNCAVSSNSVTLLGGGTYYGALTNCTLSANSASYGGGAAASSSLYNCTIAGNSAARGGGLYQGTLHNCAVNGNVATNSGGGTYNGTLYDCTLTGNSAGVSGGGAYSAALTNCIVYYNTAPDGNYSSGSKLSYCCTLPLPMDGTGNLAVEPQLASASHLSANSLCLGAGSATYARGLDIDGEPWATPPAIGCDEYWSGSVTGALSVAVTASITEVLPGVSVDFQALIGGRVSASSWDFGDGLVVSNRPYASHAWAGAGVYAVVLRAYNGSYPDGVTASVTVHVAGPHYAALSNPAPVWPYNSWATAATNIQDAVDAAGAGDEIVVTNGVYETGARVMYGSNRVAVTKAVVVRSVNGPKVTVIRGRQMPSRWAGPAAVRCVYLTNGAVLSGFTVTNGATLDEDAGLIFETYGGGVLGSATGAVVTNCVLTDNHAGNGGGGAYMTTLTNCTLSANGCWRRGGGAAASTINHCNLIDNWASMGGGAVDSTLNSCTVTNNGGEWGGGAMDSTLNNCTVINNSAYVGGGTDGSTLNNCTVTGNYGEEQGGGSYSDRLNNCIVYYNTAPVYENYQSNSTLNHCCATPLPAGGTGNFTNAPLFVDRAGGNLRLQTNSPCINAGRNAYSSGAIDLDGNSRISGGTVDVGAYEVQFAASVISYAWLQWYRLPADGSADYADADHDGRNNWQEWVAGTDPTNAASFLQLKGPVVTLPGLLLRWSSDTNHSYFVQRATSLKTPPSFTTVRAGIPGLPGATAYADATASRSKGTAFYRIGTGNTNGPAPALLQRPVFVPASATLTWTSVTNRAYFVERATNAAQSAFTPLQTNIPGSPDTTSFTDTSPPLSSPAYYRVGVHP
jgi:hypothetical protein